MDDILILIPSLDPDQKLIEVIASLKNKGFSQIVVVNDGSVSTEYFEQAQNEHNCVVLTHKENHGKGRALKTGFEYILAQKNLVGVVTVDGDNQHKAPDVLAVSQSLRLNQNSLILGVRNFNSRENIPFRSRIGNQVSAKLFQTISKEEIQDTQTGLRGIPFRSLKKISGIPGERFEYEMNMLLGIKKTGLSVIQIPIETVYLENNDSSHFRPIWDSVRVLKSIVKYSASGIFCFLLDYGIFSLLVVFSSGVNQWLYHLFFASVFARICSSIVNFILNYNFVFKCSENIRKSAMKYFTLVVIQMLLSSAGTTALSYLSHAPLIIKPLVDLALFFLSYFIQKRYIFQKGAQNETLFP